MRGNQRAFLLAVVILGLAFPGIVLAAAPTADAKTPTTLEDTLVTVTLTASDVDGDPLTFSIDSGPTNGSLGTIGTPICDGLTPSSCAATVDYTPDPDYNGSDSFTYIANDGGAGSTGDSLPATVSVSITAVNDAPSFTKGGNQSRTEDGGQFTVSWATNPSTGPADESSQTYSYIVSSNDHPEFFSAGPSVATNGELSYTLAANKNGIATVGVKIQDNGGTANGGVNQSAAQTFTISIAAVNDNPTPQNDIRNVQENAPVTAMNVLANDNATNPDGPEVLTIVSINTTGTTGTVAITGGGTDVSYQPPANFQGDTTFKYTVQDPDGASGQATVLVSVGPDTTGPVATAPVETLRTGVTMGSTVQVHLTWSATDAASSVAKYQLAVSVDGGAYQSITLPTNTTTVINRFLSVGHTYQYKVRATDVHGNTGAYKFGPAFKVLRFQDTSASIVYGGTWGTVSSTSYSGGTMHFAGGGRTATLTTSGRDFAIVGPRSSTRGSFQVYVDGVLKATVSETGTATVRRVLWSIHFPTLATHTIRIVVIGTARVDLDCFLVLR